jgi:predicted AlkP superfamily phosphohydrolase/phosphomutase
MLAILHLDALSPTLLAELIADGRLPVLQELHERGHRHELETPATHFPASTYFSMHSGLDVGDHGHHFSFQWSPEEQRLRHRHAFGAPTVAWERLAAVGKRSLVIDPYELAPPRTFAGRAISGWQLANILSLERWSVPKGWHLPYERRLGRSQLLQEVFGRRSVRLLHSSRRTLLGASARVADLALEVMRRERFDLVYLSLLAPHQAGHVFWDVSQLEVDERTQAELDGSLALLYEEADRALGRILAALPDDADLIVVSPLGMGANTSRVDLLGDMLELVLDGGRERKAEAGARIWRFRAAVPTSLRAAAARAMGGRLAREVTARMSTSGLDWSAVRAFLLPSDENGLIRLNVRGREREGILHPAAASALMDELVEGLGTFRDVAGGPAVSGIDRPADMFPGRQSDRLPDLVVRWSNTPSAGIQGVQSERYGEVRRRPGGGTGRNGSHTADAWALIVPGSSRARTPARPARVNDIAATVSALFGVAGDAPPGEPLLERP